MKGLNVVKMTITVDGFDKYKTNSNVNKVVSNYFCSGK